MNNIEALDIIFNFFPKNILKKLKKDGLYDPILSGKIKEGSQLYEYLPEEHASIQDADYTLLANDMSPFLNIGSILQIGCGRGNLLLKLSKFNLSPIYGIDRSDIMLARAKKILNNENAYFFNSKIEDFDFSSIGKIDNIIMNNFWGMISKKSSIKLLNGLKKCLKPNSVIIIGDYIDTQKTEERKTADKTLKDNLNFIFAYPFFKNFSECGYKSKIIKLDNMKYFKLNL